MSFAGESCELAQEAGAERGFAVFGETGDAELSGPSTRKGTIAISAAFLFTSAFVFLALLLEPLYTPATDSLQLRASLMPAEFSCSAGACTVEHP